MSNWKTHVSSILDASKCAFGLDVEHQPKSGLPQTITAIFDNEAESIDPDTEIVVSTQQPQLGVKLSDFDTAPLRGDLFIVEGITYHLIELREDGQGGATLLIHKL